MNAQVGYCTVYTFLMMPGSKTSSSSTPANGTQRRLRLSQLLVLPPYQRQGVATQLVEAVYKLAAQREAYDLTVRCC